MKSHATRLLSAVLVVGLLLSPATAVSKDTDYFERDASGNGVYEQMAIHPTAIFDTVSNTTYIAYQGYGLDPYVAAYDHSTGSWEGPVKVGTNPMVGDAHGGPSMVMDQTGILHVFFGAHGGAGYTNDPELAMHHVRSRNPRSIASWRADKLIVDSNGIELDATYPMPQLMNDGTIRLFFRNGAWSSFNPSPWTDAERHDWAYLDYDPVGSQWTTRTVVVEATKWPSGSYKGFYGNFEMESTPSTETAFAAVTWRDWRINDGFERRNLYYIEQTNGGRWVSAVGSASIDATAGVAPPWTLETLNARCLVPGTDGKRINQVVAHQLADGNPAILFLQQANGLANPQWRFAQWTGAQWEVSIITETDNLFDAGDFEERPSGRIDVYLTTGGTPDETAKESDPFATRGGDITHWRSDGVGGSSGWSMVNTLIQSTGTSRRYNDPQVIPGHHDEAVLSFCEWNNDTTSFVHRVYLYGSTVGGTRFRRRDITPRLARLSGPDRVGTAIATSKRAFPEGTSGGTVLIATSHQFADALASTPLCATLRAPLLLNGANSLDPRVRYEIQRLGATNVILLGGEAALSASVRASVANIRVGGDAANPKVNVSRIAGHNRYATSQAIADEVEDLMGDRGTVVLASGENFPDALAVAGLAGRKGYPILLTRQSSLPTETAAALGALSPDEVLVVGGQAAVSSAAQAGAAGVTGVTPERIWGPNRYATAAAIASESLDRGFDAERIIAVTGENYPDALTGGWFAARYGALVTLARPTSVPSETKALMARHFSDVIDVYVLGGEVAVGPTVAAWYATGAEAVPE